MTNILGRLFSLDGGLRSRIVLLDTIIMFLPAFVSAFIYLITGELKNVLILMIFSEEMGHYQGLIW